MSHRDDDVMSSGVRLLFFDICMRTDGKFSFDVFKIDVVESRSSISPQTLDCFHLHEWVC